MVRPHRTRHPGWAKVIFLTMALVGTACAGDPESDPTIPGQEQAPTSSEQEPAPESTMGSESASGSGETAGYLLRPGGTVLTVDADGLVAGPIAEDVGSGGLAFVHTSSGLWLGGAQLVHLDPTGAELGRFDLAVDGPIVESETGVWVVHLEAPASRVSIVDPATNTVTGSMESEEGQFFKKLAVGDGSAWVTWNSEPVVGRIDPTTMTIDTVVDLNMIPLSIAWGGGSLWMIGPDVEPSAGEVSLVQLDPSGAVVQSSVTSGADIQMDIGFGFGSVWYVDALATDLVRIDPTTLEEVARISIGPPSEAQAFLVEIEFSNQFVWVSNPADETVRVIDPSSNETVLTVTTEPVTPIPSRIVGIAVIRSSS